MIVTLIVVLFVLILGMGRHIKTMADQLELLDREQHTQNNEIAVLMRNHLRHQEMLLQHSEVLAYLAERDETLKKYTIKYSGIVGEA
jgi:Tfp pilus assembly protein PilO